MPSLQQQKRHREKIQILLRAAELCEKDPVSKGAGAGTNSCILMKVEQAMREINGGPQLFWRTAGFSMFGTEYADIYRKNDRIVGMKQRKEWAVKFLRDRAEKLRKGGGNGSRSPAT